MVHEMRKGVEEDSMRIFVKYLAKCMTEKKSRLFLLIFSISISVMLLVASIGVLDIIMGSYASAYTIGNEGAEVVISSKEAPFFDMEDIDLVGVTECKGEINYTGILSHANEDKEMIYVTVRGKEKQQVEDYYHESLMEGKLSSLEKGTCLISKRLSDSQDLHIGDRLLMTLSGEEESFEIVGICANTGVFYMDMGSRYSVVVNYESMEDYFGVDQTMNVVYAKITENTIESSMKLFQGSESNKNFEMNRLYNDEAVREEYLSFFISTYAMLGIVIIMCFVIIYGAFSLILNERMSAIGTFLSLGATKLKVKSLLYLESICYGIIGGLIGNAAGVAILYVVNTKLSPLAEYGIIEAFSFHPLYLLFGFAFAVTISFLASALPIRKMNRLPVKEVILKNFYVPVKTGWVGFMIGILMLAASAAGMISDGKWTVDFSSILSVCVVVGIVMISPKLIHMLSGLICKIMRDKSSILFLAFNNIKTSRVLMANVILIMITLISSISINAVSQSIIHTLNAVYTDLEYHMTINNIIPNRGEVSTTDLMIEELEKLDYVKEDSINPIYKQIGYVDGVNTYILGVMPERYAKYMTYLSLNREPNQKMYGDFTNAVTPVIIVADKLLDKMDKKVGDMVPIKMNDLEHDFEIVGTFDAGMYFSGMLAIIPYEYMKAEFNCPETSTITLSVTNEEADTKINKVIFAYGATSTTKAEEVANKISTTGTLCQALILFSQLIIVIAVLGIVNNMLVGFLQRKKELALLSSIGMSKGKKSAMLFLESVITVWWSVILIVPYSFLMVKVISKFMKWTGMPVTVALDMNHEIVTVMITLASVLIATVPVFMKSRKISIIGELRQE